MHLTHRPTCTVVVHDHCCIHMYLFSVFLIFKHKKFKLSLTTDDVQSAKCDIIEDVVWFPVRMLV